MPVRKPKRTLAPRGYREFIREKPFMSMVGHEMAEVKIGVDRWEALNRFNILVNNQAVYYPDEPGKDRWGPWRIINGLRRGDCEDYAIHKLQALVANDWPRGACRLTICEVMSQKNLLNYRDKPVYHCVLLVYEINKGALILDNRRNKIIRVGVGAANEYRWIAEEWPDHKMWRKL